MTPRHTRQTVRELLAARVESDLPDDVLDALRPFHGKPITTRLLAKMPKAKEWRLIRHYGWTDLQSLDYIRSQGREGITLMLARSESAVPLDVVWVEKENPAFFEGRRARNHARMEAMNTAETLDAMAAAMNRAEAATAELAAAAAAFDGLVDRHALVRACGLSDHDGRPLLNHEYRPRKEVA